MAKTSGTDDRTWLRQFGYRVRAAREAAGISQADAAHEADIHPTYLSGIETGRRNPSLLVVRRLAAALNVTPSQLLD